MTNTHSNTDSSLLLSSNPKLIPNGIQAISKPKAIEVVLNLYQPDPAPETLNERKPMHLYDINFVFSFHKLETEYVRLGPLIPSKHLEGFLSLPEESWAYLGDLGPYDRKTALEDIEAFRADPQCLLLAVIDIQAERAERDGFAGVYGLQEVEDEHMVAVFGVINILPKYHRTHINSHAMFLILCYLFDELNLVRVQYDAATHNVASIRSAQRFGFRSEGIGRNLLGLVPSSKKRKGEEGRQSQDCWISSMTDYEWDKEGRAKLNEMISRPVIDTSLLRGYTAFLARLKFILRSRFSTEINVG